MRYFKTVTCVLLSLLLCVMGTAVFSANEDDALNVRDGAEFYLGDADVNGVVNTQTRLKCRGFSRSFRFSALREKILETLTACLP